MDGAVKSSWETQKNTQNQSSIEPEPGFWVFHYTKFCITDFTGSHSLPAQPA